MEGVVEPGRFEILTRSSSEDIRVSKKFIITD